MKLWSSSNSGSQGPVSGSNKHSKARELQSDHVTLEWRNVSVEFRNGNSNGGNPVRTLDAASGRALPGRLLAILGPSGSGKTTLLKALAGQLPQQRRMSLSGDVTANGSPTSEWQRLMGPFGFVHQEDLFFPLLTVRETLRLAADLKFSGNATETEKETAVGAVLERLSLTKCAETFVGDGEGGRVPGVSGGERKRLSLGLQLLGGSSVLFADEPTTGLDSAQALEVMRTLRQLAAEGTTVIATVHQPRSAVWHVIDDVMILSEGRTLFCGPVSESLSFFEDLGLACPSQYNPLEFLIDLAGADADGRGLPGVGVHEERVGGEGGMEGSNRDEDEEERSSLLERGEEGRWKGKASVALPSSSSESRPVSGGNPNPVLASSSPSRKEEGKEKEGWVLGPSGEIPRLSISSAWRERERKKERRGGGRGAERATDALRQKGGAWKESGSRGGMGGRFQRRRGVGLFRQFVLLAVRSFKSACRDFMANGLRLLVSLGLAVLYGTVFGRMSEIAPSAIEERVTLLVQALINMGMIALVKALSFFGREQPVVERERRAGLYGVLPYLIGKLCVEAPIDAAFPFVFGCTLHGLCGLNAQEGVRERFVGSLVLHSLASSVLGLTLSALVPSTEIALATGPALFIVFILIGGFMEKKELPGVLKPLRELSTVNWTFRALAVNEFRGAAFRQKETVLRAPGPAGRVLRLKLPAPLLSGEEVLEKLGLREETVGHAMGRQTGLMVAELGLCLLGLSLRGRSFAKMKSQKQGA